MKKSSSQTISSDVKKFERNFGASGSLQVQTLKTSSILKHKLLSFWKIYSKNI